MNKQHQSVVDIDEKLAVNENIEYSKAISCFEGEGGLLGPLVIAGSWRRLVHIDLL